jgi:hypothetical protein
MKEGTEINDINSPNRTRVPANRLKLHSGATMRSWRRRLRALLLRGGPIVEMTICTLTVVTDVLRFESCLSDLAGTIPANIAEMLSTEQPAPAKSLSTKEVQTFEDDFTSVFESRDSELYRCLISVVSGECPVDRRK